VAGVSCLWALFTGAKGPPRVCSFVLFAIFATGAFLALYHAGAEQHWWRGPQGCSATNTEVRIDDVAALLSGAMRVKPPQCDVIAWQKFGISMAGYNVIISTLLAIMSLLASMRITFINTTPKDTKSESYQDA